MKIKLPTMVCGAALGSIALANSASAVTFVSWSFWAGGNEAPTTESNDATGMGIESAGDWRENVEAASTDGTFGTNPGASTAATGNLTGTYIGASQTDGSYDFMITAGATGLNLDFFRFDAGRKRTNSAREYEVSVVAGDITNGVITSGSLGGALGGPGPHDLPDYDIDLSGLADKQLSPGETATFRITFFNGTFSNNDQKTYLDNVAITGQIIEDPALPGDTDGDGDIDDADLGTAFSNFTGPVGAAGGKTAAEGDTDGDGDMDDADLANAFSGFTGPLGPAAVPEPASLAMLGLGGLLAFRRRRDA